MRFNPLLTGLVAAFLSMLSSGCSTTDGSIDSPNGKYWVLGSRVGEVTGKFEIYQGTPMHAVQGLLGAPTQRKSNPSDASVEIWIYERKVNFGSGVKTMQGSGVRMTSVQRRQYQETAVIHFKDGKVDSVRVTRYADDVDVDQAGFIGK